MTAAESSSPGWASSARSATPSLRPGTSALAGKSGITRITRFDPARLASQIAGEVKGFDVVAVHVAEGSAPHGHVHPLRHGGGAAGLARLRRCRSRRENAERIGINFGSGIGGLPLIEAMHDELRKNGPRRISPFFIPGSIINMIAGTAVDRDRRQGPEPGDGHRLHHLDALHRRGAKSIRYGEADVMIAGGAEAVGHRARDRRLRLGARALDAQRRSGHRQPALGQGARRLRAGRGRRRGGARGVRARRRRAARSIYCELVGYGVSADAYHMTAPSEDGDGAFRCMRNALQGRRARRRPRSTTSTRTAPRRRSAISPRPMAVKRAARRARAARSRSTRPSR